ncbi:MAG TPA: metal-dependent hydrolase [Thermoanaerobaculia bacterium]|nr:metal-dependent hydrolase [Thermoanaerobaculia bacterium]
MDPLTHTLVGANLASTRLGSTTRLAAAALVIGANLPDVDSILYFTGQSDLALDFRRGWTHGVLAIVVLPLLLAGVLWLIDRRSKPAALLGLSALAVLTHPALDWLNSYGLRWLMPFRGTWFYGDSVYIMDPWLWLILGCGWLAGRSPSRWLVALWAVFALLIAWVVSRRSPEYLVVVAIVAVVLLAALIWRPRIDARRLAAIALALAAAYIGARLSIHAVVAEKVRRELAPIRLMVGPDPIDPLRWDVVAQIDGGWRRRDRRR